MGWPAMVWRWASWSAWMDSKRAMRFSVTALRYASSLDEEGDAAAAAAAAAGFLPIDEKVNERREKGEGWGLDLSRRRERRRERDRWAMQWSIKWRRTAAAAMAMAGEMRR